MAANGHTLNEIINDFKSTLKPGSKLSPLDLQNALFDDLALRSQNKAFHQKLKEPGFIENLKKGYLSEIDPQHPQKNTYNQVVEGAFKRFNLSLLFRQALFVGPILELFMGRESSRKRQAILEQEDRRHQKKLEEDFEEFQEEIDKEDQEEEQEAEERLVNQKKNDEEEEKHSPFRELGKSIGHALVLLASQTIEDPKKIADNLSHNILELNKNLQETLKLKPNPEHSNKLNKDIADFGQTLKQTANPEDPNRQRDIDNQFNKVLLSIRNQRDHFKEQLDKTHPNNSQAQQLLFQWEAEVGRNLTQMISNGNVQKYDNNFKVKLAKDWNAVATNSPPEGLSASPRPLTLAATVTAAATLQNPLAPSAPALKDDQGQAATKKQGPFALRPPKPTP